MTTIREFTDQITANIVASLLRDNDIEVLLTDENASAWVAARALVPIRLQVPDEQVQTALDLLKAFDAPSVSETKE